MKPRDLVNRQKVTIRVAGDVLVVTMPGTTFNITYEKTDDIRLVASSFHAQKMKRAEFLPEISQPGLHSRKREGKGAWLDQLKMTASKGSRRVEARCARLQ